jgi:hypothetical protein
MADDHLSLSRTEKEEHEENEFFPSPHQSLYAFFSAPRSSTFSPLEVEDDAEAPAWIGSSARKANMDELALRDSLRVLEGRGTVKEDEGGEEEERKE